MTIEPSIRFRTPRRGVATYTYDATYRLRGEWRTGTSDYRTTHTYGAVGNRLVEETGGQRTTFSYDPANQLTTSVDPAAAVTSYLYDGAGNLAAETASGATTSFTWNADNRLIQTTQPPSTIVTMAYNADGLRVRKLGGGSPLVKSLWDFQNLLAETDVSGVVQAAYTLAPKLYGDLVSQRRGATSHFALADALGSIVGLATASGGLSDSYRYKAYGEILSSTGSTVNPFRWVGKLGYQDDGGLNQYYVRARHYDPVTARWMSPDPLVQTILSDRGLHTFIDLLTPSNYYLYAFDRPTRFTDPSGLFPPAIVSCLTNPVCRAIAACLGVGLAAIILELILSGGVITLPEAQCALLIGCFAGLCSATTFKPGPVWGVPVPRPWELGGRLTIAGVCAFLGQFLCEECRTLCQRLGVQFDLC